MLLMTRAIGAGSASGNGLVVAPRRLTAFAMRVAAEARVERVRTPGVAVEPLLRRVRVGVAAAGVEPMAAPSAAGVFTAAAVARRAGRRDPVEEGLRPVDFGAALATVELGCEALLLDLATLGLATLGLVVVVLDAALAAVLADSFAAAFADEEEVFGVRACFASDFALAVRFTATVGAAFAAEDPGAAELVALLGLLERRPETLAAVPAGLVLAVLEGLSLEVVLALSAALATPLAVVPRRTADPRALAAALRGTELGATVRVRWESTKAHSSSLRLAGLAPLAWATRAAFSMSATRLVQEVAKRLSDWDLAPLSTRVSITPAADTFLRRRLKISFWSWAIRASALSLSWIVS